LSPNKCGKSLEVEVIIQICVNHDEKFEMAWSPRNLTPLLEFSTRRSSFAAAMGVVLFSLAGIASSHAHASNDACPPGGLRAAVQGLLRKVNGSGGDLPAPVPGSKAASLAEAIRLSERGALQMVEYLPIAQGRGQVVMSLSRPGYVLQRRHEVLIAKTPDAYRRLKEGKPPAAASDVIAIDSDRWLSAKTATLEDLARYEARQAPNPAAVPARAVPPPAPLPPVLPRPGPQAARRPAQAAALKVRVEGREFQIVKVEDLNPASPRLRVTCIGSDGQRVQLSLDRAQVEDAHMRVLMQEPQSPYRFFVRLRPGASSVLGTAVLDGAGPALNSRRDALLVLTVEGSVVEVPLRDIGVRAPERVVHASVPGAALPTNEARTMIGAQTGGIATREVQLARARAFGGAYSKQISDKVFMAVVDGKRVIMPVDYRKLALDSGKIFENPDLSLLPRGRRYTWTVLDDGSTVFGEFTNGLEMGIKHGHLANGRKVVAAGEALIANNGTFVYNLESGTFSMDIVAAHPLGAQAGAELMRKQVDAAFRADLPRDRELRYVDQKILDRLPPQDLRRTYCWMPDFYKINHHFCD
jgi:hypothetical protein